MRSEFNLSLRMIFVKVRIFCCLIVLPYIIHAQTKVVFTAIDYSNNEVRAVISDSDGGNRAELGFNKTYLPVWFNGKILLNSDYFVWQCDTSGQNLHKLFPGYRSSVSNNKTMIAFYDKDGISISDEKGRIIKQISVNAFQDVAITWSFDDKKVSYFNSEKNSCFLFNIESDSLEIFGDSIYHPVWSPDNKWIMYNRFNKEGRFSIIIRRIYDGREFTIGDSNENAVVPIWSSSGNKIAYLSINLDLQNLVELDLVPCKLFLFELNKMSSTLISEDAGFTDNAYPQMCFDESDEFIYYTKINENNLGSIARINLKNFEEKILSKDFFIDERFPQVKSFSKK